MTKTKPSTKTTPRGTMVVAFYQDHHLLMLATPNAGTEIIATIPGRNPATRTIADELAARWNLAEPA